MRRLAEAHSSTLWLLLGGHGRSGRWLLLQAQRRPPATLKIAASRRLPDLPPPAQPAWSPVAQACLVISTCNLVGSAWGYRALAETDGLALSCIPLRPSAGKQPEVKAIHAGLECGIIGEKLPGLDCVSYGPTIT